MAETEKSALPKAGKKQRQLKVDQLKESENCSVFHSTTIEDDEDDNDDEDEDDSVGEATKADCFNSIGDAPKFHEEPEELLLEVPATPTPSTSPSTSTNSAVSVKGTRQDHQYAIADCEVDLMDADDIIRDLPVVIKLPPFDPCASKSQTEIVFKPVVSLMQLSLREDNVIEVEVSKKLLSEYSKKRKQDNAAVGGGGSGSSGIGSNGSNNGDGSDDDTYAAATGDEDSRSFTDLDAEISMKLLCEYSKNVMRTAGGEVDPITDLADIFVKHEKDEFYTFCSCKECLEYRETIMSIMVDQFKAAHMVVMLLDVLSKAYSPLLKNDIAFDKFEKLIESNKEIYWITNGYLCERNADYIDFIDDSNLSDNMILVLFSSILMVNNPMLLLQILSYNVECILKAFKEGIIETSNKSKGGKMPAFDTLVYILDGYTNFNTISQKISLSLFTFENDFLRKFRLTWVLLCQRLFQQHVHKLLADTMLSCIIAIKEKASTQKNTKLIKRYILFDEHMNSVERRWNEIWPELNKFNLSQAECLRRDGLLDVHSIFDIVVMDATSFSLPDISDNESTDFKHIENRHVAWRNIMAFTKLKWPDGFYDPPNMIAYEDKCSVCDISLDYHQKNCKCVTCCIAGPPTVPLAAVTAKICSKCTTQAVVDKNPKIKKPNIIKKCTVDDAAKKAALAAAQKKKSTLDEFSDDMMTIAKQGNNDNDLQKYHIAWAVFHHLTTRKRYRCDVIELTKFCPSDCRLSACLLARKILNNEVAPIWTQLLTSHFQPLSFTREELRATLPSLMYFNRKMSPSNASLGEFQAYNYVLKTYWTFILSFHANYFMKFHYPSPTNLSALVIENRDVNVRLDSIIGNKQDVGFEKFLYYIKKFSPFNRTDDLALLDVHIEQTKRVLDRLMSLHDAQIIKNPQMDATMANRKVKEDQTPTTTTAASAAGPDTTKKTSKEKVKKCCPDNSDMGEHCKENHTKKRVRKDCNHTRANQTRDRLRKKFANICNERRKNNSTNQQSEQLQEQQQQQQQQQQQKNVSSSSTTTEPPKAAAVGSSSTATAVTNKPSPEPNAGTEPSTSRAATAAQQGKAKNAATVDKSLKEPPTLKSAVTVDSLKSSTNERTKLVSECSLSPFDSLCERIQSGKPINCSREFREAAVGKVSTAQLEAVRAQFCEKMVASLRLSNGLGVVNEFYEFLDNYTKEQEKKWINETLNFIEGKDKSSQQPQTANPKKAAKKAKQKMRKEEEKRISELEDLRSQFTDLYFKEFRAKQELKTHVANSNKKRDKKRRNELEVNIKNLQRGKSAVESRILELIATVKQANSEFKFTYLPTKEQQIEKMYEQIGEATLKSSSDQPVSRSPSNTNNETTGTNPSSQTVGGDHAIHAEHMNLNMVNNYIPTAFNCPNGGINNRSSGVFPPPLLAPMCYAPPQQQQLPIDVVAAMAANSVTADPAKRIVTIRRVNMPNENEPQVTVTAKGSSPEEDEVLYHFINGQMMTPSTLSTHPPSLNDLDLAAYKQIRIPSLQNPQHQRQQLQQVKDSSKRKNTGGLLEEKFSKLNLSTSSTIEVKQQLSDAQQTKRLKKQKQKALKASKKQQAGQHDLDTKASTSSTTTCSNSSSQSQTPMSSSMHTRDNSVCSQKPPIITTNKPVISQTKNQGKTTKGTKKQQQQHQQQSENSQKNSKNVTKVSAPEAKPKAKLIESVPSPASSLRPPVEEKVKVAKPKHEKQSKLIVDNSVFDNNPYKYLNQDSSEAETDSNSDNTDPRFEDNSETLVKPPTLRVKEGIMPMTSSKGVVKSDSFKAATIKKKDKDKDSTAPPLASKKNTKPEGLKHNQQQQQQMRAQPHIQQQKQQQQQKSQSSYKTQTLNSKQQQPGRQTTQPNTENSKQQRQQLASTGARPKIGGKQHQQTSQQHVKSLPPTSTSTRQQAQHQIQSQLQQQEKQNQRTQQNLNRVAPTSSSTMQTSQQKMPYTITTSSSAATIDQQNANTKFNQRNTKRYPKQKQDCMSGIPNNMGHFNLNELDMSPPSTTQSNISPSPSHRQQQHQQQPQVQQQQLQLQQIQRQQLYYELQQPVQEQQKLPSLLSTNSRYDPSGGRQTRLQGNQANQLAQSHSQPYNGNNILPSNVSIMEQLNRGVQVENLSLPPGITLTKIDPQKSEILRQKSESIQKVLVKQKSPQPIANGIGSSMPPGMVFSQQSNAQLGMNPVSMYNYYDGAYGGIDTSGIVMVETNPKVSSGQHHQQMSLAGQHQNKPNVAAIAAAAAAAASNGKSSSRRRRRNKTKSISSPGNSNSITRDNLSDVNSGGPLSNGVINVGSNQIVTLRNPMFHGNTSSSNPLTGMSASVIQEQPSQMLPNHSFSDIHMTPTLHSDKAEIIKNENGMFTIRSPAAQYSNFRPCVNLNYLTVAEATRATQLSHRQQQLQLQQQLLQAQQGQQQPLQTQQGQQQPLQQQQQPVQSPQMVLQYFQSPQGQQFLQSTLGQQYLQSTSGQQYLQSPLGQQYLQSPQGQQFLQAQQLIQSQQHTQYGATSNPFQAFSNTNKNSSISSTNIKSSNGIDIGSGNDEISVTGSRLTGDAVVIARPKCISAIGSEIKQKTKERQDFNTSNPSKLQEQYQKSNYCNFRPEQRSTNSNTTSGGGACAAIGSSHFEAVDSPLTNRGCGDDSPPPIITGSNSYLEGIPYTRIGVNNEVSIHKTSESNFLQSTSSPSTHHMDMSSNVYSGIRQQSITSVGPPYCDPVSDYVSNSSSNRLIPSELDMREPYNFDFDPMPESMSLSTSAPVDAQPRRSPQTQSASPYNIEDSDILVPNLNALRISDTSPSSPTDSETSRCNVNTSGGAAITRSSSWW